MRWRSVAAVSLAVSGLACGSGSSGPGMGAGPLFDAAQSGEGAAGSSGGGSEAGEGSTLGGPDSGRADATTDAGHVNNGEGGTQPDAASGDDASSPQDDGGGISFPPVEGGMPCSPTTQWGTGTLVSVSTSGDDRFGAITPDELTIAWMTPDSAGDAGTTGTVHYADRGSASASFGASQTLAAFSGYFAFGPVALSPDGLTMIVVRSDLQGFGTVSRASRGDAFGSPDETQFAAINLNHQDIPVVGSTMGDPVFTQDGQSLFFTDLAPSTSNPIDSIDLTSGGWSNRTTIFGSPLLVSGTQLRRPTGLSSDRLTLFFFDEVSGVERAIWRTSPTGTFSQAQDVGALLYAQPNAACSRLYYSAQGASSVDLFYADGQ